MKVTIPQCATRVDRDRAVDQGGLSRGFRSREGPGNGRPRVMAGRGMSCMGPLPRRSQELWRKNGHRYHAASCYRNSHTASCNCCDGAEHRQQSVVCQSVRGQWRRTLARLAKCTCLRVLSSRMPATWRPSRVYPVTIDSWRLRVNTVFPESAIACKFWNALFFT